MKSAARIAAACFALAIGCDGGAGADCPVVAVGCDSWLAVHLQTPIADSVNYLFEISDGAGMRDRCAVNAYGSDDCFGSLRLVRGGPVDAGTGPITSLVWDGHTPAHVEVRIVRDGQIVQQGAFDPNYDSYDIGSKGCPIFCPYATVTL